MYIYYIHSTIHSMRACVNMYIFQCVCVCALTSGGRFLGALFADGESDNVSSVPEEMSSLSQVAVIKTLTTD